MKGLARRGRNRLRKEMNDVGYGGKRAGTPAVSRPVDVPIMAAAAAVAAAAVKEKTPTAPQSRTAPNVRHRR